MWICCRLFSKPSNLVQTAKRQQFSLVLNLVWYSFSGRLDGQCGSRHGVLNRGQFGDLVRLVAFRHTLSDSHSDAQQACLHLSWDVGSESLPVLLLLLLLMLCSASRGLASRSGNRI